MKALLTSDGLSTLNLRSHFRTTVDKPLDEVSCLIIPFACDVDCNAKYLTHCLDELRAVGLDEENIYILPMNYVGGIEVTGYDVVMVPGGNTYQLLKRLKDTHLFDELQDAVLNGSVYYYGVSAGSCIAADDISYIRDTDPNDVGLEDTRGLWLNTIRIWPHTTTEDLSELMRYEYENLYLIADGEAVYLTEKTIRHII